MPNPLSVEIQNKETVAKFLWTGFIIMFFVIQAIIWTIAISLTRNDVSHAMVSGFDVKISAEEQLQKEKLSKSLGWQSKLTVTKSVGANQVTGSADVVMRLQDRAGQPVLVPSIQLLTFHCGQAALIQEVELNSAEPGIFVGKMRIHRNGNWQFNSEIKSGEKVYLFQDRQYITQ